ncbi:Fic family protein [Saccharicrinis sp. FJH2]|uniref:Fic family protein n=1 Tax=Saccharicrinis sp. FJH65 TaxID=3344659 RepID=UPI0035F3160F
MKETATTPYRGNVVGNARKKIQIKEQNQLSLSKESFNMSFEILTSELLVEFTMKVNESPLNKLNRIPQLELPVDYFQFYKSVSSVYSSKIEGEDIDFDSYFKHKFMNVKFKADYTKKADDLYSAYEFIDTNSLNLKNVKKAHSILSSNLLPKSQQGQIRNNPMFVINSKDQIEYVAASPESVNSELDKLFRDIELLQKKELNSFEIFYYASLIHLVFVKIHPFQDGNGRTARLIEKWFLQEKIGEKANSIQLEKNYYKKLTDYYHNIRKLGLEYEELNYKKSLDFLLMTIESINEE